MKREHFGWILFAIIAALLLLFFTKKKGTAASVAIKTVPLWDSSVDPGPPSNNQAPPFQDAAGNLICAPGYSLWQDKHTGNYACFRDPNVALGTIDTTVATTAIGAFAPDPNTANIFQGATLTDAQGNPIPGGT